MENSENKIIEAACKRCKNYQESEIRGVCAWYSHCLSTFKLTGIAAACDKELLKRAGESAEKIIQEYEETGFYKTCSTETLKRIQNTINEILEERGENEN